MKDGAQISLDFLFGVTVFLLTFTFVVTFLPGLFVPFRAESDVTTLLADQASIRLVEDLLVDDPGKPNLVNWTLVESFFRTGLLRTGDSSCGSSMTPYECNRSVLGLLRPERSFNLNVSLEYANGTVEYASGPPEPPTVGNVGRTIRIVDVGFANAAGTMENKCSGKKEGYFTSDCTYTTDQAKTNWKLLDGINPQSLTCTICITNVSALVEKEAASNRSSWGGLVVKDSQGNWIWRTAISVKDAKKGKLDVDSCNYSAPSSICDYSDTQDREDNKCETSSTGKKIEKKHDNHPKTSACIADLMTNPKYGYQASVDSATCNVGTFTLNITNGDKLYGYYACTDQSLKSTKLVVRVW